MQQSEKPFTVGNPHSLWVRKRDSAQKKVFAWRKNIWSIKNFFFFFLGLLEKCIFLLCVSAKMQFLNVLHSKLDLYHHRSRDRRERVKRSSRKKGLDDIFLWVLKICCWCDKKVGWKVARLKKTISFYFSQDK